jgi:hypothetical protein
VVTETIKGKQALCRSSCKVQNNPPARPGSLLSLRFWAILAGEKQKQSAKALRSLTYKEY